MNLHPVQTSLNHAAQILSVQLARTLVRPLARIAIVFNSKLFPTQLHTKTHILDRPQAGGKENRKPAAAAGRGGRARARSLDHNAYERYQRRYAEPEPEYEYGYGYGGHAFERREAFPDPEAELDNYWY